MIWFEETNLWEGKWTGNFFFFFLVFLNKIGVFTSLWDYGGVNVPKAFAFLLWVLMCTWPL